MTDENNDSFLHEAGPLRGAAAEGLMQAPDDPDESLAAVVAELGVSGLRVAQVHSVQLAMGMRLEPSYRLFHWEKPEVVVHLNGVVDAVIRTVALLEEADRLGAEREAERETEDEAHARAHAREQAREQAWARILFDEDLAASAGSIVPALAGLGRDAALAAVDRLKEALLKLPEHSWPPEAPDFTGPLTPGGLGAEIVQDAQALGVVDPPTTSDTLTPE